jgi:hypothetical protein
MATLILFVLVVGVMLLCTGARIEHHDREQEEE